MESNVVIRYVVYIPKKDADDIVLKCCRNPKSAERFLKKEVKSKNAKIVQVVFDGKKIIKGSLPKIIRRIKSRGSVIVDVPVFDVKALDYEFEVGMAFDWLNGFTAILDDEKPKFPIARL